MSVGLDISQYALEEARGSEPLRWNLGDYLAHWSPSSFDMARRCPRQWQERYIHGKKERPAEAPVTGSAVHKGLEHNFAQKITSGIDLPMAEVLTYYDDEGFAGVVEREQEESGSEVLWDTSTENARARGRAMLSAYHAHVAPRLQPAEVEIRVEVAFGLAVPVIGYADLVLDQTALGVVDWKTGKQKQSKPKESWRIQGAIYGEARDCGVEFHSITASAERHSVSITTPLESEALLVHPSRRERDQMRIALRSISAEMCMYMDLFGPDIPWPTHGRWSTWACDWCGFRKDCPAWESER